MNAADCTREPGLTRIAIAPSAVKFYEGRAEVIGVEENGSRELLMQVEHVSEGLTSKEIHTLKLDDKAKSLIYQRAGLTYTYHACSL